MVVAQTLKPPPPLYFKPGYLAPTMGYAKPRVSIASLPATTIPTHSRGRNQQLSAKDFAELDATYKRGGSTNAMGRGFGFACSLCLKEGHTR
jgi:hypothetical protein